MLGGRFYHTAKPEEKGWRRSDLHTSPPAKGMLRKPDRHEKAGLRAGWQTQTVESGLEELMGRYLKATRRTET